jgi:hypothetical protein
MIKANYHALEESWIKLARTRARKGGQKRAISRERE